MTASANQYGNVISQALSAVINFSSDSIMMALLSSGYTPNLTSHAHWSDVNASEITGTGYTAGGVALASKSITVTAANSFATTWSGTAAHVVGDIIRPASGNGFLYLCSTAGTTASSTPTFPTVIGQTVTDGTVVWTCLGESITQLTSVSPTWASAAFSTAYGVIYDSQTGVAATEPLIALINFGGTQSPSGITFQVTVPSLGWAWWTPS